MPELSILSLLQLVVGLGLLNVWLLRAGSATEYRGRDSKTLKEEFQAYGLPDLAFYVVGALKIGAGIILLAGLWFDLPVRLAGGVVALLMVGALAMHMKVGDPAKRSVPAALMLLMSGAIVLLAQ
ncbi:MAG: DoxX family protein [Gemmatimonadetes bacterium]|nr:DoxX family protein [Gemmatimonadota bacterium]NNM33957.1 DoxX family protein [Gemmatimonadota bacterium]